jgi:hypothetical protein
MYYVIIELVYVVLKRQHIYLRKNIKECLYDVALGRVKMPLQDYVSRKKIYIITWCHIPIYL